MEFPLDVDTGTNIRGISRSGDGSFWVSIDPNIYTRYRMDTSSGNAKEISSDRITISGGTVNSVHGITTDRFHVFVNHHALRSGVHRERATRRSRENGIDIEIIETEAAAGDAGNRNLGTDWGGDTRQHLIYQANGAFASKFRTHRWRSTTYSPVDDIGLVAQNIKGVSMYGQGEDFWTVGSDNIVRHFRASGAEIENFTLTNSGTAQDICHLGGGLLAVAMT